MSRGTAPPHLQQVGTAERTKITLYPSDFEGMSGSRTHRVTSTGQTFDTLANLPNMSSSATINLYVLWSTDSTTTTQTATWRLRYAAVTPETDATTASVAVLTSAIAADTVTATANMLQRTAAGVIDPNNVLEGDWLKLRLDCSAVSGLALATDVVNFHGVEIEFVRAVV